MNKQEDVSAGCLGALQIERDRRIGVVSIPRFRAEAQDGIHESLSGRGAINLQYRRDIPRSAINQCCAIHGWVARGPGLCG